MGKVRDTVAERLIVDHEAGKHKRKRRNCPSCGGRSKSKVRPGRLGELADALDRIDPLFAERVEAWDDLERDGCHLQDLAEWSRVSSVTVRKLLKKHREKAD